MNAEHYKVHWTPSQDVCGCGYGGWPCPDSPAVDHGIRGPECEAGTCDCSGDPAAEPDRAPTTEPTEASPQPVTDETPACEQHPGASTIGGACAMCYCGLTPGHGVDNGRGAAARFARYTDTTPVGPVTACLCGRVDVSSMMDKPASKFVRCRTDHDCPLHGDMVQLKALGPFGVGDVLTCDVNGHWTKAPVWPRTVPYVGLTKTEPVPYEAAIMIDDMFTDAPSTRCDHGYCDCGGGPGIVITTEKGRRGILAAIKRFFGVSIWRGFWH